MTSVFFMFWGISYCLVNFVFADTPSNIHQKSSAVSWVLVDYTNTKITTEENLSSGGEKVTPVNTCTTGSKEYDRVHSEIISNPRLKKNRATLSSDREKETPLNACIREVKEYGEIFRGIISNPHLSVKVFGAAFSDMYEEFQRERSTYLLQIFNKYYFTITPKMFDLIEHMPAFAQNWIFFADFLTNPRMRKHIWQKGLRRLGNSILRESTPWKGNPVRFARRICAAIRVANRVHLNASKGCRASSKSNKMFLFSMNLISKKSLDRIKNPHTYGLLRCVDLIHDFVGERLQDLPENLFSSDESGITGPIEAVKSIADQYVDSDVDV